MCRFRSSKFIWALSKFMCGYHKSEAKSFSLTVLPCKWLKLLKRNNGFLPFSSEAYCSIIKPLSGLVQAQYLLLLCIRINNINYKSKDIFV